MTRATGQIAPIVGIAGRHIARFEVCIGCAQLHGVVGARAEFNLKTFCAGFADVVIKAEWARRAGVDAGARDECDQVAAVAAEYCGRGMQRTIAAAPFEACIIAF